MQTITDWATLWKELVEIKTESHLNSIEAPGETDYWRDQAREFDQKVKAKASLPDSSRALVYSKLDGNASILDIGAGTGAWVIPFAQRAKRVTAVEPSAAMREVLVENIAESGLKNIEVLSEGWMDCQPKPHDHVFCSHAMYGEADFEGFVNKMTATARKMCYLLIRCPATDGLINEAFQELYCQPHDSPNFTIAYNLLLQMGIHADVQFEPARRSYFLCSESVEDALTEIKRRMGLCDTDLHDRYLRGLLQRRLVEKDGQFLWPGGSRSALIYWTVN